MTPDIAMNTPGSGPARRSLADAVTSAGCPVSHNLNGQRLGRKGRITRERILAAAIEIIDGPADEPLSLSAVARKCGLGLTSLYNYFADLTELLLAVLEPVMETAEEAYLARLRERWPDEELGARCEEFVRAYHGFWARHSRLLHLRNSMADSLDQRMMMHRVGATQPIIAMLMQQMDCDPADIPSPSAAMATMVMIGIERSVTVTTDRQLPKVMGWEQREEDRFVVPGGRLMELAIREMRTRQSAAI